MTSELHYIISQTTGLRSKALATAKRKPHMQRVADALATALNALKVALDASKEG